MKLGIITLAAVVLVACHPSPAPNPPRDAEAGPLPRPADVCTHLAALGCSEGADPACARKLAQVESDRLTLLRERCWMAASDRAAARACGQLTCAEP